MHSLAVAKESHRAPRSVSGRSEPARIRGAIAEGRDAESIDRLAELSGEEAPEGAVLFAERDGQPVAAIGILDGKAVADRDRSNLYLRMRLRLERLFVLSVISVRGM